MKLKTRGLFNLGLAVLLIICLKTTVNAQTPCPLNFYDRTLDSAKVDLEKWDGEIIACDVEVVEVQKGYLEKPYFKVRLENGGEFWVGSLVKSGYEIKGAKLRLLGYFAKIQKDDIASKFNKDSFHILAFAIIDLATKQLAMLPGANLQIKEWLSGSIPKGRK